MKAERRHALQSNALATKLVALPDFGKIYGRRIALVIGILIVAGLFVYHRSSERSAQMAEYEDILSSSREVSAQLGFGKIPADARKALERLQTLQNESADVQQRAEAWCLNGDLNWKLYKYLDDPTGPAEQRVMTSREDLIKQSDKAYRTVLDKFSNDVIYATAARFGLAAIAEEQAPYAADSKSRWKEAADHYTQIINMPDQADTFKKWGQSKLENLKNLQSLPVLGEVSPEISLRQPSSLPGSTFPTTARSATMTAPSQAAIAATAPATALSGVPASATSDTLRNPPASAPISSPAAR